MKLVVESPGLAPLPNTRWSLILDAQREDLLALAEFCREYWFPLYAYARRTGLGAEDAADLTQAFFERVLSREVLAHARRERGRLRNFLVRAFHNFSVEEWRRQHCQRRAAPGGVLAMDALTAEERLAIEPLDEATPEVEFERAWAREVLRQARDRLRASYEQAGEAALFAALESGPYRLAGGFQVPDGAGFPLEAPVLRVELLSGDALRISWPTRATGFVLHEAPSLGLPPSPSVWSPIPFPYQTNDTDISITTPLVADRYFRLQRP